jgi:hypothetical protein
MLHFANIGPMERSEKDIGCYCHQKHIVYRDFSIPKTIIGHVGFIGQ